MIKNYLKIAFRNLLRHRAFSLINIAGLAIGMASSILILLWVQNESSFDRWHAKANRIYRITADASGFKAAVNCAGMPAGIQAAMPEIVNTVRLSHPVKAVFDAGDNRKFMEKNGFYVDSTFFEFFNYRLVKGDARVALKRIDGVIITASMAKKYFGSRDPMGRQLKKDNSNFVTVTGVLADIPSNSHLQFDYILPMAAIAKENGDLKNAVWNSFNFYSYVELAPAFIPTASAMKKLITRMDAIYVTHQNEFKVAFTLQPLTSIHLDPALQVDLAGHGNRQYVQIFFYVALFILVVACINFMNLATARSERRAKEVGLRKVVGALRGQLIGQFIGEAMLISLFSLLLALIMVWLLLPQFNRLAQKDLVLHLLDGRVLGCLLGIALITGAVAGSYPALFLSGFRPVKVLKGGVKIGGGNLWFRNGLVITQFVVSIVLLVGTTVIYRQLTYIREKNLGFDKENLVYMSMNGELWDKQPALKTELERDPLTHQYAMTSEIPIDIAAGDLDVQWEGKDPKSQIVIPSLAVNENFIDVFRMEVLAGRGFGWQYKGDSNNFVINETLAKVMGRTAASAVGKPLSLYKKRGMIIGVVKDFNFKPVQQAIEPLILQLGNWAGTIVVRAPAGKTGATIKVLARISKELNPSIPFEYNFLDQDLAHQYKGEQQMGTIFNLFAGLAIFISCLGLYGLSAFLAQQRTREIGVRKVLGASVLNIVYLLSTGFTRLILVAVVIAVPLSFFVFNRWLGGFAYHIPLGWSVFAIAIGVALAIAWLTVSYESLKAAVANPTRSLRSE